MAGKAEKLGARLYLGASGLGSIKIRRTVTAPLPEGGIAESEAEFRKQLAAEHDAIRQISAVIFRVVEWKHRMRPEWESLGHLNVTLDLEIEADDLVLVVRFVAEYEAPIHSAVAKLAPLVHPVKLVLEDLPPAEEIPARLDREWTTLKRVLTLGHAAGDGVITQRVPPPFLDSKPTLSDQSTPLEARAATPEEAKLCTERYLDIFKFPYEIEEDGVGYAFIPRVELSKSRDALRIIVTLLGPPETGRMTFKLGGSKEVELPLKEVYVQGHELNRKTKEGILELIKGLCRALGKQRGLATAIDISRPR